MKKEHINRIIFSFLCCVAIALGCYASAISLLTHYTWLSYLLLSLTYFAGILLVKYRPRIHEKRF